MYWAFYKSTIAVNLCVSLAIFAITQNIYIFAASIVLFGPLCAFLYKEVVKPLEYYFYYNRGISKTKLIIFCLIVNILPSTMISLIAYYVAST